MTPEEAYQALAGRLTGEGADPIARAAWKALDDALKGNADLPEAWARLTLNQAADRIERNPQRLANLVSQGYAPPPDGHDGGGRAWWHPVTVDDFKANGWSKPRKAGAPPPRNASRDAWVQFADEKVAETGLAVAKQQGVPVYHFHRRDYVIEFCRKNQWLP